AGPLRLRLIPYSFRCVALKVCAQRSRISLWRPAEIPAWRSCPYYLGCPPCLRWLFLTCLRSSRLFCSRWWLRADLRSFFHFCFQTRQCPRWPSAARSSCLQKGGLPGTYLAKEESPFPLPICLGHLEVLYWTDQAVPRWG